jgi:hypothetical protein
MRHRWVGALATAAALVTALFRERILDRIYGRRMRLKPDIAVFDVGSVGENTYTLHAFIRLKLTNRGVIKPRVISSSISSSVIRRQFLAGFAS